MFHSEQRLVARLGPVAAIATALLLAACGAGATGSPGDQPTDAAATAGPTGGAPGTFDLDDLDFDGASSGLEELDSYRYTVELVTTEDGAIGGGTVGTTRLSGTVINGPTAASQTDMTTLDEDGNVTEQMSIIVIGDQAWTAEDGGAYESIPAEMAPFVGQIFAAFRPEQLFGQLFLPAATAFDPVGEEQRNGVATVHYRGDESIAGFFGIYGASGATWSADVWLAKDGGYLVSSAASATGDEGEAFRSAVDITNINDPSNAVEPPG